MPPKADKLTQNLQSLQLFLQRNLERHPEIEPLNLQLKQLETLLETKKLILQIISEHEISAQALFDLLSTQPNFLTAYQIKLDALPDLPKNLTPQTLTTLTLRCIIDDRTEIQQSYPLTTENFLIGRNPDAEMVLNDPQYRGISWKHALIKSKLDATEQPLWQLEDRFSTNGTFVNGQPITTDYILQPKDKITLASPHSEAGIVELIFDHQNITPDTSINEPYLEIINSDVLLIVVNLEKLSEREISLIKGIDTSMIAKVFIVPELFSPEEESQLLLTSEEGITRLESVLKAQESNFEILPVFLKPYYVEDYPTELGKNLQKKQDNFIKSIENIIKRQPENILAARLAIKTQTLLEPLAILFTEDKILLQEQIIQQKKDLEQLTHINLKEVTKKALNTVNEEKDKFFKKVKLDVAQAKGAALDNFSKRSIVYQVQNFVDQLQPVIIKRDGQSYIQLAASGQDVNRDLLDFCISWLEEWGIHEWEKISYSYNNGGLNNLIVQIQSTLNIIPSLLDNTSFSAPQALDIRSNLMMSFAGIICEVRHKQVSLPSYLMKEIRTNMMQYMMMITLVLALIGIRGGKNQIFEQLSKTFKSYPLLLGAVIFGIFFLLMNAYRADNQMKLDEASEKLGKELAGYYQSLSKNLIEKIIQEFNLALDYEAKKIEDTVAEIQSNYNEYIIDIEKIQVKLQANLEQYKEKEKNLDKETAEFQKLIRM
ncbi:forkhead-associated protein [Aphanothece hegewaldii CCALA 016]|uniref:Forkhead-associated protein n=1 Tax=Aphanothece hegewaldii CCALA 016 TaxID=2107694 RepID=A0A2T1LRS3_9CHRO|nr:FHA domain-containing protein [Aphanothece hegewaldii]PSF31690.1 forkhead-associated protein [Aphanothece hegewaldii CCALA 016]